MLLDVLDKASGNPATAMVLGHTKVAQGDVLSRKVVEGVTQHILTVETRDQRSLRRSLIEGGEWHSSKSCAVSPM